MNFESILLMARCFERVGIEHYLCGSMASSIHGVPRATNDFDFAARLNAKAAADLCRDAATHFDVDEE